MSALSELAATVSRWTRMAARPSANPPAPRAGTEPFDQENCRLREKLSTESEHQYRVACPRMARVLLIALAGAAGSVLRYAVSVWAVGVTATFPLGTLLVNLVGSFLIGFVMTLASDTSFLSESARVTLSVGLIGGFTTYSSFNYETLELLRRGSYGVAWLSVGTTFLGCLLAGILGLAAGTALRTN